MARKKISFGIGSGIASLAIDGIAGLLILRLLLHYLAAAKAGYWVLVTSAGSLLLLLQCGMGPTIARAVAQSRVGGDEPAVKSTLGAIGVIFRFIALGVILASIVIFVTYLLPAANRGHLELRIALSWFPYALGMVANLQGQASLFVLDGYGEVGWDKLFRSVYSSLGILSVWLALYLGFDIPTLGTVYLILNLLFWIGARQKLRSFLGHSFRADSPQKGQIAELLIDGFKLLFINLLTYLITQFTIFVVEVRFGITKVAPYVAMLKVAMLIGALGTIVPQMLYPYVATSWASRDFQKCRRYYLFGVSISLIISLALSGAVFLLAHPIFNLWLGPGRYLGDPVFGAILLFYLLFVHICAHATPVLAALGQTFAVPAVINTILVLLLVYYLPTRTGLVGIPLGMCLGSALPTAYVVWRSWIIFMREPRKPSLPSTETVPVSSVG